MALAKEFPEYECILFSRRDNASVKRLTLDSEIYLVRNVGLLHLASQEEWLKKKTICMLESDRALGRADLIPYFKRAQLVVAQNTRLRDMARKMGITNMADATIGNGINTKEFYPAPNYPNEFTVGASGNFSLPDFDQWKGFGQYIVPACKLAGVKLRWCGWKGKCASLPDLQGEQVPLDRMGDWYRGLNCLVSYSVSEGCSGVTFEAMATGLPVISTKVGWHGDVCDDSEIRWVTRPQEETPANINRAIEYLANEIILLKNNQSLCREMGANARRFAEKWPHSRRADQWRTILSSTPQCQPPGIA